MPHAGNTKKTHLIGAHMSIAGGVFNALLHGKRVGCNTIQIFTKSNQQWKARKLESDEINRFMSDRDESGIRVACAHASYLINLASPDAALFKKSLDAFVEELERCELLEVPHLVIHPGSHMGKGETYGLKRVAEGINRACRKLPDGKCKICLETTAGQGSNLGSKFSELAEIIEQVDDPDRISICLDTCHVFAAGYEMNTETGYKSMMREFNKLIGVKRIAVVHCNDSKFPCGAKKDRHEHIGKGEIGLEGFRLLMNDRRFSKIPKILETPKGDESIEDKKNIKRLWDLIGKAAL